MKIKGMDLCKAAADADGVYDQHGDVGFQGLCAGISMS